MLQNKSTYLATINVPSFKIGEQERHYMLPFTLNNLNTLPQKWAEFVKSIKQYLPKFSGVAYLTVDQKVINHENKHHRRGGAHIDGNYIAQCWNTGWLNGKEGRQVRPEQHREMYIDKGLGTILISDYPACQVWTQPINAESGIGGNCEHLRNELDNMPSFVIPKNHLYHISSDCIHESLPIQEVTKRTLVRITLPKE